MLCHCTEKSKENWPEMPLEGLNYRYAVMGIAENLVSPRFLKKRIVTHCAAVAVTSCGVGLSYAVCLTPLRYRSCFYMTSDRASVFYLNFGSNSCLLTPWAVKRFPR